MTKHYNYPEDIVNGWDTGTPVEALCGYSRVLVEGRQAEGEVCEDCARIAKDRGSATPHIETPSPEYIRHQVRQGRTCVWVSAKVRYWNE